MKKLLDYDPVTKTRKVFHASTDGEQFHVETLQDVTDLADQNKALLAMTDERANWKGDMHRVASIPMAVYMDLQKRGIVDDTRAFKRWLNDPDNRVFRTRPGTV